MSVWYLFTYGRGIVYRHLALVALGNVVVRAGRCIAHHRTARRGEFRHGQLPSIYMAPMMRSATAAVRTLTVAREMFAKVLRLLESGDTKEGPNGRAMLQIM